MEFDRLVAANTRFVLNPVFNNDDMLASVRATDLLMNNTTVEEGGRPENILFNSGLDSIRCCTKHPTINEAVNHFILLKPTD